MFSVVIKVYVDGFSDSSSEFPINSRKEFYFLKSEGPGSPCCERSYAGRRGRE